MINLGFIITLCCSFNLALSQHIINLEIKNLPPDHPSNSAIYIAGSFNDWNPKDEKFRFVQNAEGNYAIQIKLDKGRYEYKITRGSWDKVECRLNGQGISNRQLPVDNDISIDLIIEQWQDRLTAKARASTANKSVHVMDTAFWIPQLKRTRRIWIYLPATYHQNKKERFDVLYLHDGQNVFDDSTSFAGEWGVDESMAMLTRQSIVVAIDHGGNNRNTEYNPYDHDRYGKGEGNQYVDFIAKTLKPHIDKNYRTRKGKENTMIAGSSLAGLVTMYAVLKYPKVFGGAGVFFTFILDCATDI